MKLNKDDFIDLDFKKNKFKEKTIRLIPPRPYLTANGEKSKFYASVKLHFYFPRINQINSVFCNQELVGWHKDFKWGGNCYICDKYDEFYELVKQNEKPKFYQGSFDDFQQSVHAMQGIVRHYYNAIDLSQEELHVQVLSAGNLLHRKIITSIIGNGPANPPLGDVSNFEKGRNFVIKSVKGGGVVSVEQSYFDKPSTFGTKEDQQKWLRGTYQLEEIKIKSSNKDMKKFVDDIFGKPKSNRNYRYISESFHPSHLEFINEDSAST